MGKGGLHDCANVQDVEFSGSKGVLVEDQPPLNLTPNKSLSIPSSDSDDDNNLSIPPNSFSSDESITSKRKPKWFKNLRQESDDYLARMGKLKPRRVNIAIMPSYLLL